MRPLLALLGLLAGCSCQDDPADSGLAATDGPSWSDGARDVVAANCATCHVEGGSAPFPLQTWEQAAPLASALLSSVDAGTMPPWSPDPDCRDLEAPRLLSADDEAVLRAWVEGGALEGVPTDPIAATTSSITPTDHLVPPAAYTPPFETAQDEYHCFVFDETFAEEKWLRASRVLPGTSEVHHVLTYALVGEQVETMEALDAAEDGPGYTCFGSVIPLGGDAGLSAFPTQIAAWVPGADPIVYPSDQAVRVPAGARVVMQVHYSAQGGEPLPDATSIELQLEDTPPDWVVSTRPLGVFDLDIPAGEADVEHTSTYTNWSPEPVTVRSVAGHMHLLGQEIGGQLQRSDGSSECLLDIPEWDFDWQQAYTYTEPVVVAPGESIDVRCTFDNSPENQPLVDGEPREPEDVTWGDGTDDEMCLLYFGFIEPYSPAPAPDALDCEASQGCADACDGASWDCLLGCEDLDADCLSCSLEAGLDCAFADCTTELLAARGCLEDCATQTLLLAGAAGTCMEATCPAEYEALVSCGDPELEAGACDEPLAECGVAF